jgi:hypothetical protein
VRSLDRFASKKYFFSDEERPRLPIGVIGAVLVLHRDTFDNKMTASVFGRLEHARRSKLRCNVDIQIADRLNVDKMAKKSTKLMKISTKWPKIFTKLLKMPTKLLKMPTKLTKMSTK